MQHTDIYWWNSIVNGSALQKKHDKKGKKQPIQLDEVESYQAPKSLIFKRGQVGETLAQLVKDMRLVMSPNTAVNLKVASNNTLKDFVQISAQYHITQFFIFSQSDNGTYMRLLRVPHGPTLSFQLLSYTLIEDLHRTIARHKVPDGQVLVSAPVLILNNFSSQENHVKLMASAFQNSFPALNIQTMRLKEAKRVVLIHYDKEAGTIEFRHYRVTTAQLGITKSIKRVLQRRVDGLGEVTDIADYIMSQAGDAESDVEDIANPESQLQLPERRRRRFKGHRFVRPDSDKKDDKAEGDNAEEKDKEINEGEESAEGEEQEETSAEITPKAIKMVQSAVRLREIGPRMQLKLYKVEAGFAEGQVLYHAFKTKTEAEIEALERRRLRKAEQKAERKRELDERSARKRALKRANKENGDEADVESGEEYDGPEEVPQESHNEMDVDGRPNIDDVEWYRREVGEEPTEEEMRILKASTPKDRDQEKKFNPFWGKQGKKRSGDEVTGGRGGKSEEAVQPRKKFSGRPPRK